MSFEQTLMQTSFIPPSMIVRPPVSERDIRAHRLHTSTHSAKQRLLVRNNRSNFYVENDVLLCLLCDIQVDHSRQSSLDQHLKTNKHKSKASQQRPPKKRDINGDELYKCKYPNCTVSRKRPAKSGFNNIMQHLLTAHPSYKSDYTPDAERALKRQKVYENKITSDEIVGTSNITERLFSVDGRKFEAKSTMTSKVKNTFEAFHKTGLPAGKVIATYVWIDAADEVRSKSRVLEKNVVKPEDAPVWNFDGSSTEQAEGRNSDCWIKPVAVFNDPFRLAPHVLVLCEVFNHDWTPAKGNNRNSCAEAMSHQAVVEAKPWFGIEQEYSILEALQQPLGWPKGGFLAPQGPYYCGVGSGKAIGREIVETHLHHCLYAGVKICGTNAEVMPSQWEFQVGPCERTDIGDHLWMARYILKMVAEEFNYHVTFDPKPVAGDWNGAGCHTNYSTFAMRIPGGINAINAAIEKLSKRPNKHLKAYDPACGEDNKRRLVGAFETASYKEFSSGVANRGASIRIPRHCESDGYGYLEDRRPAANCDPYKVAEIIVRTTILNETGDDAPI